MTPHSSTKKFLTAILVNYNRWKKGHITRLSYEDRLRKAAEEHMDEIKTMIRSGHETAQKEMCRMISEKFNIDIRYEDDTL